MRGTPIPTQAQRRLQPASRDPDGAGRQRCPLPSHPQGSDGHLGLRRARLFQGITRSTAAGRPTADGAVLGQAANAGRDVGVEREPGIQAIGFVLRPDSEGFVNIISSDPNAELDIDPNFFATEHDQRVAAELFRTLRRIFEQSPIADEVVSETRPGTQVASDDAIIDAALDQGYCGYHAMGTCAMGPNESDVVDSRLRVRGVHNLRVMDCSVMPTMVSGNLNAPAMAMAMAMACG
ncbi:GMC oxidoreductase [Mycobacterium sp. E3247]|uniref:GMC oxidoreductase n=1 Tax=Mycobacterium sp. E3247 TaxID=1856864 RepID=UPI000A7B243F|nr:GMC family oxidoreductase [Mycobacterium sp. E3247]